MQDTHHPRENAESIADYAERLEAVMNTVIDGIITINHTGIIQSFNPSAERIFGYSPDEVIGKNVKVLMPDPYHREHDTYIRNYLDSGEGRVIGIGREVSAQRKDGSVFPMELGINEMSISGQRMFVGTIRDISDRKRAEEELLRSNEELERFAYIASHDLQEPVRMVQNFTSLLASEYKDNMDEQASQYMEFITDASGRMHDMISDLLEYSRIGNEDYGYTEVDTSVVVEAVIDNLNETISETGANIIVGELPIISANPVRFSRLLQNLIGNAIKYRSDDRSLEVTIDAQERENEWLFSISDNGIGIKEEYLDQIFIIFKRLHGKREYKGTGIGLAACKKIVESFDGKIWATSQSNEGTTFHFTIPKDLIARKAA